jgi:cytochrome c peroxidase
MRPTVSLLSSVYRAALSPPVVTCFLMASASVFATPPLPPPPPPPAAPAAPVATPLSTTALAAIREYLNLDLSNLFNYANPALPAHYDGPIQRGDNTPPDNRTTDAGATLGRVLFNDKRLSFGNNIACASCHQQAIGFTDPLRFSHGFQPNTFTTAHAMRLGNVRFYTPGSMFWDKRAPTLEFQATQPIQNAVEMGYDASHGGMAALIAKMQALPYYPALFQWVFGDSAISETRIQKALAQYERAMVSPNSRWDTGFAQVFNPALPDRGLAQDVPGLTPQENAGRRLFLLGPQQGGVGCAACHTPPTFALSGNSRSNGLDAGATTVFKAPSLKNAALGHAFMHDGRFATLEQVVDHYDHGVLDGPALDNRLRSPDGRPRVLNLSAAEKAALVAFMKTLTDTGFLGDVRFSDPFKK